MIFRSAYVSFSKVSTVVVRGYVLDCTWGSACAEEGADFGGGFIVGYEVRDSVVECGEERESATKSSSIRRA